VTVKARKTGLDTPSPESHNQLQFGGPEAATRGTKETERRVDERIAEKAT